VTTDQPEVDPPDAMKVRVGRRRVAALALAALVISMSATCGDDDSAINVSSSQITEAEVGDELEIRLSASPGVGDAWQVAEPPDEAVVRIIDQTSETDEPDIDGGLWEDILTLEAVGEGTTTVVMHNCFRCDDEGNTPPEFAAEAADITFTIKVG
jgi:hypothetical protein